MLDRIIASNREDSVLGKLNKEAGYGGLVITIIGSVVLAVAVATQNPYQLDYTGVVAGVTITGVGLVVAIAGGLQHENRGGLSVEHSPRRKILQEAAFAGPVRREVHLDVKRDPSELAAKPQSTLGPRASKASLRREGTEVPLVPLPENMFHSPKVKTVTTRQSSRKTKSSSGRKGQKGRQRPPSGANWNN